MYTSPVVHIEVRVPLVQQRSPAVPLVVVPQRVGAAGVVADPDARRPLPGAAAAAAAAAASAASAAAAAVAAAGFQPPRLQKDRTEDRNQCSFFTLCPKQGEPSASLPLASLPIAMTLLGGFFGI